MASRFFHKYWKLFFAGFVISFLGALPLGSLNLMASQIFGTSGIIKTTIFVAIVLLIELLVVLGLIRGMGRITMGKKYIPYVMPVAVLLLLYLSYTNFFMGDLPNNPTDGHRSRTSEPTLTSLFALGIVLGVGNPAQFPFWAGWNNWLYRKNILKNGTPWILAYLFGIGSGTIMGMSLVIYFIHKLQAYMIGYDSIFSWLLGLFYLGLAIYLGLHYYRHFLKPFYEVHV